MTPDGQAETRAVYVVQRAFRLVRRGYDPDEVDRHLRLVTEWFRTSTPGREALELKAQLTARERALAEREAQVQHLQESARVEAQATLEGARLRADSDRAKAEKIVDEARLRAQAATIITTAQATAEEAVARAQATAGDLVGDAEAQAARLTEEAGHLLEQARAEARGATEHELNSARAAGEQLLEAMRRQAADEAGRIRQDAETAAHEYVDRRRREIDRLVAGARGRQVDASS